MRKIRVYMEGGYFTVEVPDGARMTFGYFNPTRDSDDGGAFSPGGRMRGDHRRTCLRIYDGPATDKNQVAVFLGAVGFRDEALALSDPVEVERKAAATPKRTRSRKETENVEVRLVWSGLDP